MLIIILVFQAYNFLQIHMCNLTVLPKQHLLHHAGNIDPPRLSFEIEKHSDYLVQLLKSAGHDWVAYVLISESTAMVYINKQHSGPEEHSNHQQALTV